MFRRIRLIKSIFQCSTRANSTSVSAINNTTFSSSSNNLCKYSIKEISIPKADGGIIAGQLWSGEQRDSCKTLPPIICTHGIMDNLSSFKGLLPLIMKPNMRVLSIDFPGHGLSSHLITGHYDLLIDGCKTIRAAANFLECPKVILMGHSMGAVSSFVFSAVYPELTDRLIAIDFHPFFTTEPIKWLKFLMERQTYVDEKLSEKTPPPSFTYDELLERLYLGRKKGVSLEGCKHLLERGAKKLPDGKFTFSHDLRATIPCGAGRFSFEQIHSLCKAIICPVCIIKSEPGGAGGIVVPFQGTFDDVLQVVDSLNQFNSNVELHIVSGNHFVHINDPQIVAPVINSFLET